MLTAWVAFFQEQALLSFEDRDDHKARDHPYILASLIPIISVTEGQSSDLYACLKYEGNTE